MASSSHKHKASWVGKPTQDGYFVLYYLRLQGGVFTVVLMRYSEYLISTTSKQGNTSVFDYAHIGPYIKQVCTPFFNNLKLLLRDVHLRIDRTCPVGSIVTWTLDKDPEGATIGRDGYLLECNGQTFDTVLYPKLYRVLGSNTVPDYRGYFFRASGSGQRPGEKVGCSIQAHTHGQPSHTHRVSGTAEGQKYYDMKSGLSSGGSIIVGSAAFKKHVETCFGGSGSLINAKHWVVGRGAGSRPSSGICIASQEGSHAHLLEGVGVSTTSGSHRHQVDVPGNSYFIIDGGYDYAEDSSISGTAALSGGDTTYSTGSDETAPMHMYVRYYMRAR